MKYCPRCGAGLQDSMCFCPKCGQKFQDAVSNETEEVAEKITAPVKKHFSKKKIGALCVGLLALTVCAIVLFCTGDFTKNAGRIEKATESVVQITCYDKSGELRATGSGFVVYDDSTIVTNYHVIDRALEIRVSSDEDHTYLVESILVYNKDADIAILKTAEATGLRCLKLGNSDAVKKGEDVVAIGSPLGIKNTVSKGVFSGRYYDEGIEELQFSAPISSGSSGGALFNKHGEVIGVTSASFVDGQNLNLAAPSEEVEKAYQNKTKLLSCEDCFREVYGAIYLMSEDVDFVELQLTPDKYCELYHYITTTAYLMPIVVDEDESCYFAFATESEAEKYRLGNEADYIECKSMIDLDRNYEGYAIISGQFVYNDASDTYIARRIGYRKDIEVWYYEPLA